MGDLAAEYWDSAKFGNNSAAVLLRTSSVALVPHRCCQSGRTGLPAARQSAYREGRASGSTHPAVVKASAGARTTGLRRCGGERVRNRRDRPQHRRMQQRDAEQTSQAARQQIGDARESGKQSAAAQDQRVSLQSIGGMRHNRSGEHPNEHGSCQHKPDVLRLQSALA